MVKTDCNSIIKDTGAQVQCLSNYKLGNTYDVFNAPTYFFLMSKNIKIYRMNKYLKSKEIHFALRRMIIEQLLLAQEKYVKIVLRSDGIAFYNLKPFLNP